jgi:hypothetical protein
MTVVGILIRSSCRQRWIVVLLMAPIVDLWITVFHSSGKTRYRIPFAGFALIVASNDERAMAHWRRGPTEK